jgi:dolichyl-phosphate-mannose-protein mannosyltransferase
MNREILKKSLQFTFSVLAFAWIIFGYDRYLSSSEWAASKENLLQNLIQWIAFAQLRAFVTTTGILDVVIVLGLWAASDFLGGLLLQWLGVRLNAGAERIALSSAAGLAMLSLATTILTVVSLLYRAAAWTLVSIPVVLWLSRRAIAFSQTRRSQQSQPDRARPPLWAIGGEQHPPSASPSRAGTVQSTSLGQRLAHGFLLTYVGIALGITLISALAPPLEFDDIAYHLHSGKTYIQKHRFQALPQNPVTFMPKNVEMLYALGMLLHNEVTAKLIHYLMGVLTMLAAYALGTRLFTRSAGLVALAALAASPLFLWEMRTAHVDVGLALYVFASLYATVVWLSNRDQGWFWLVICFSGFSLGIKYHGLFALGAIASLVLLHGTVVAKNPRAGLTASLRLFLLSLVGLMLPWGAVNLYLTGNPVFPMFPEFFHTRYWTPELTRIILHQQKDSGIPLTLANWPEWGTVFWRLFITEPGRFHGNLGPFCLLLLPLTFFQRRIPGETKLILSFSLIYGFLWLLTAQHSRYMLAVLPGLAAVTGTAVVGWFDLWRGPVARGLAWAVSILLALMAMLNLPFSNYGSSRYGSTIKDTLPVRYLLARESRDEYLARHIQNYSAVQFFNRLPGPKHVLFWWNTNPAVYYANSQASYHFSPFVPRLETTDDPTEIHRLLKENGVTHVIVGQRSQEAQLITRSDRPFAQAHLKKIYQKAGSVLYEFSSQPLSQETIVYDFLGHIREATIRMPNEPPGKPNSAYRMVTAIGPDSRYSLLGFPPSEVEYSLTLCERPLLQFAVGQAIPGCSGRGAFRIWLSQETGKWQLIYSRELYAAKNPRDVGWIEERLDLEAFGGKQVKILFETKHLGGGSCVWYCWAGPVILSKPADS